MKTVLLAGIFTCCILQLSAQSEGPKQGSRFTIVAFTGSSQGWTSPDNASPSDDQYSDFGNLPLNADTYTDYLVADKFQFNIPAGSIITGILVEIECSDPMQNTYDYSVRILKNNTITGDEKAQEKAFPAADEYISYGGAADLWGETWTSEDINESGFGVAVSSARKSDGISSTEGKIDDIRITIFFSAPSTLPVTLLHFSAKKNKDVVDIAWTTTQESNMSHYEIERSANGRDFSRISSVSSLNKPLSFSYTSRDNQPLQGLSYYRLKMLENDGSYKFSAIVTLHSSSGNNILLYPNPLTGGAALNISNPNRQALKILFSNSIGQAIGTSVTTTSFVQTEFLKSKKGIVFYQVVDENNQVSGSGSLLIK